MTTTWPRYRTNCEFIGDEGQQCGYSFQHSCEQHIEHEGRAVQAYPSETFPRPGHCHSETVPGPASEQAPALPVKSKSAKRDRDRDRDRERGHGEHREHKEHREKEHRSRTQDQHKQAEELRAEHPPPPDCIDCAVSAPNGNPATMQGIDIGYSSHGGRGNRDGTEGGYGTQTRSNRERDGIESGYSTQNRDGTTRREDKDASENRKNRESHSDTRQETSTQPEQIQYIEGDGCQVWRPQALNNSSSLIILL